MRLIEGIDITFLEENDNYINMHSEYKYFYPVFKASLFKSYSKYEFNRINKEKYPDINFSNLSNLLINYFNNNYKKWEPLTEDLLHCEKQLLPYQKAPAYPSS